MIVIEGPRNAGKTFLISKLMLKSYKISFLEDFVHKYHISFCEAGMDPRSIDLLDFGYAVGKDLALFKANEQGLVPKDLVVDRSFLSTNVYARMMKRVPRAIADNHVGQIVKQFMVPDKFKTIMVVIVLGKTPISRSRDEMDCLDYYEEEKLYKEAYERLPGCHVLQNHFDESSVKEFQRIIQSCLSGMWNS